MKLKVCGLSKPYEVETCVSLQVDYCVFILNYTLCNVTAKRIQTLQVKSKLRQAHRNL